jgi:hypothetical protein
MAGKCSERKQPLSGLSKNTGCATAVIPGWPEGPDPESMNTSESFFRIAGTILELVAAGFIDVGQDDHSKAPPELLMFYRN